MKYEITAVYKVRKKMLVEVPPGGDPLDPSTWASIQHEHDIETWLCYVEFAATAES